MTNRTNLGLLVPLLAVLLGLSACAARRPPGEAVPAEPLFEQALIALHSRHWSTAQDLFERFVLQYPTHPRAQEARMRLGDAYFGKKEYVTAANEYSRLANDYPAGPYADDARFKVCESYYKLSPKPQLDQQYTTAAVDHCQSLITYYPTSEFAARAQELVTELRDKLASKEFLVGEFYFKRSAYDSAILYYERAVASYADTNVAPRALLRLYQTYTILNYKDEAEAARQRILKDYPSSPAAKQLQPATAAS